MGHWGRGRGTHRVVEDAELDGSHTGDEREEELHLDRRKALGVVRTRASALQRGAKNATYGNARGSVDPLRFPF